MIQSEVIGVLIEGERQRMRKEGLEPSVVLVNTLILPSVPTIDGLEVIGRHDCPVENVYMMTRESYEQAYEEDDE